MQDKVQTDAVTEEFSEEDGLDAGFTGDVDAPPPADDPPTTDDSKAQPQEQTPKGDQPAEKPVVAKQEDDLDARFKNYVEGRFRNFLGDVNKKFADFESRLTASATAATAAVKAQGNEAPTQAQVKTALQSGEKFKQLKSDFPEWGEAIEEEMLGLSAKIDTAIAAIPKSPAIDTNEFATHKALAKFENDYIESHYPDWATQAASDGFKNWFKALPDSPLKTRVASDQESVFDVVKLLNQYTESQKASSVQEPKAPAKPDPKQQRLAGAAIRERGSNAPPASSMSEDEAMELGFKSS
jgi:hypothetical protein